MIQRPMPTQQTASALLRHDYFQIAYVTNDIAQARDVLSGRYGISAFQCLEGTRPNGGHIHVELAWVGGVMIELLTASGPGSAMFNDRLPPDGSFAIRHHHLGYFIYDDAQWDALHKEATRLGVKITPGNVNTGFLKSCFVEAPELGHYLEYIYPEAGGIEFFQNVPAN